MSDNETQTLLLAVKLRVRELELEACAVHAKHQEALSMQEMLEQRLQTLGLQPRPRGRPPRNASTANQNPMQGLQAHLNPYPSQILEMPERVSGAQAEPEPESAAE